MPWKTEISLKNNTDRECKIKIPKGQIFENKTIGTGKQNVVALKDYEFTLLPKSTLKVEIDVLCINQRLSSPSGLYNITQFKINKKFENQDQLWNLMNPEN
ncbi:MAG: hypothetical protein LBL58_08415 [Tannerellaceae bacterium]|jgi:hypothetical protein|nr:hypothetical protein [Tannerellaceae bacterium]